jgi:hypothetical protein
MHRIALKSRVRLEAPRLQAFLSSQYLCGCSRPDTSHVIHEISIQDAKGNLLNRGISQGYGTATSVIERREISGFAMVGKKRCHCSECVKCSTVIPLRYRREFM